jgi:hypothetical protein
MPNFFHSKAKEQNKPDLFTNTVSGSSNEFPKGIAVSFLVVFVVGIASWVTGWICN